MSKKIIFDMSFISSKNTLFSGVAKYGHRILEYIEKVGEQDNYILLLNEASSSEILQIHPKFEYKIIGKKWMRKTKFFKYFFYMMEFKKVVNEADSNLVFCPYGGPICSPRVQKKKISVIHDLQVRIDSSMRRKRDVWLYSYTEDRLAQNSDYIFTISDFSKNQILSYYPEIESKLINMSNSISMEKVDTAIPMTPGFPYLLYVGRLFVQKNVMTLLRAFNRIKDLYPSYKLVLVAGGGEYWEEELLPYIRSNELVGRIVLTGRCSEEDLARWYLGASVFVFPSLREGFGYPPLEAAFMEIPVVTSKADSLEEVTLGLLNYYDPPIDDEQLADAICKIIVNPPSKEKLHEIHKEYERHYSIEVIGKRICDFLCKENK